MPALEHSMDFAYFWLQCCQLEFKLLIYLLAVLLHCPTVYLLAPAWLNPAATHLKNNEELFYDPTHKRLFGKKKKKIDPNLKNWWKF